MGDRTGLKETRAEFNSIRTDTARIVVRPDATISHPERGFTSGEVIDLIQGSGILRDNHVDNPALDTYVWHCKDEAGIACEIAIVFGELDGKVIIAISAFRRV